MNMKVTLAATAFAALAGVAQAATVTSLGALPTPFDSTLSTSFAPTGTGNAGHQQNVVGSNLVGGCAATGSCRRTVWEGTSEEATGQYSSISHGIATFTLSGLFNSISLLWGSADVHNVVEFYNNGILVDSVNGNVPYTTISGYSLNGQGSRVGQAYVKITSGSAFDSFVLKATGIAFEYGVLTAGDPVNPPPPPVPLPASALLLLAGIAGFGVVRSRAAKA